jgi:hypothetical protein
VTPKLQFCADFNGWILDFRVLISESLDNELVTINFELRYHLQERLEKGERSGN